MVCAHGKSVAVFTIVDWQPFNQFTVSAPFPFPIPGYKGVSIKNTYQFNPTDTGTKLFLMFGKIEGRIPLASNLISFILMNIFPKQIEQNMKALIEKIKREKTSGLFLNLTPIKISSESISTAVKESLSISG